MSPQDISRIQPITPGRTIARESGDAAAKPAIDRQGDTSAVKVETGVPAGKGINPGQPPVDRSRVELIRSAIQKGKYPVNPTRIADAIIAAPFLLRAER